MFYVIYICCLRKYVYILESRTLDLLRLFIYHVAHDRNNEVFLRLYIDIMSYLTDIDRMLSRNIFNVANIRVFLIHDNRNFFLILSVLAYFSLSIYNRLFMISFLCLFLSLPLSVPLSCYVNIFCANTKVRTFIFSSSFENCSILFSSNRKLRTQVM